MKEYPKWIKDTAGRKRTVNSAVDEARHTGKALPPTLETVIAAGYAPDVAASIVANEQEKADKGYPPYGTNEPPEFDGADSLLSPTAVVIPPAVEATAPATPDVELSEEAALKLAEDAGV